MLMHKSYDHCCCSWLSSCKVIHLDGHAVVYPWIGDPSSFSSSPSCYVYPTQAALGRLLLLGLPVPEGETSSANVTGSLYTPEGVSPAK
jgi:hypothetical protein